MDDTAKEKASLYSEETEPGGYEVAKFDFGHVSMPYVVCLWILLASAMKVGYHRLHMSKFAPESCVLIVFGVILGAVCYGIQHGAASSSKPNSFSLTSNTFFFYLLPPIVLDAGYFMPNRAFFDNLGTILLYAVVGTIFNVFTVGFALYAMIWLGVISMPTGTTLLQLLVFSTVVSAVDPVAVLAVFEEIHVNQVLHIIVFGESLLNDAVTVVLYHMFEEFSNMSGVPTGADFVKGVVSFFVVALGGTAVGVVWGLLTALLTKYTSQVRIVEPIFIFAMAYFAYLTAELFHLSGIMAIVFCGITMKQYVEANISQKSHTTVKYFLKMLSNISETVIFALLGLSTLDLDNHEWNGSFVAFTLLFCLVFRFLGVVVLTRLANRRRVVKMDRVSQFVMGYGGIRGAVTYSLVVLLDKRRIPARDMMVTAAIAMVLFTCFVQGASIKPLVELLKVKKREKRKPSLTERVNERLVDHVMAGVEDIAGNHGHHYLRDKFEYYDGKYFRPVLMRDPPRVKDATIIDTFTKLHLKDAVEIVAGGGIGGVGLGAPSKPPIVVEAPPPPPPEKSETSFPRVTDLYGAGEMSNNSLHQLWEDNTLAPRQFHVYKRADMEDKESVRNLRQLHDRRESTSRAVFSIGDFDGDEFGDATNHRFEERAHRSSRLHHHRHHHKSHNGSRLRHRRHEAGDRSPPLSVDESPHDSSASHSSSDHHCHNSGPLPASPETREEIGDTVIPDVIVKDLSSAYELPFGADVEERRRRFSSGQEELPTLTETTLPWRKDNAVPSDKETSIDAHSLVVCLSHSHSTLNHLAAESGASNPELSRRTSSHYLLTPGEDAAVEGDEAIPAAHHSDPIYSRHRNCHGSRHEMSLQECQMALDVAVDEAEDDHATSPEDRAHLHHSADPKLMRRRGELFEWSHRHKAPRDTQEIEENPMARIQHWLQMQSDRCDDGPIDDLPFVNGNEGEEEEAEWSANEEDLSGRNSRISTGRRPSSIQAEDEDEKKEFYI